MTARLALWAVLAAGGWAYAFWVYRTRELAVPRRNLLAALRGGAVAVVLLLLLNLPVPGAGTVGGRWRLTDVSSSMTVLADGAGESEQGAAPAREAERSPGSLRTLSFGADGTSRLAPALTRALEGGAGRVEVVTDLRLDDPAAVEAILRRAPVPVVIRDVGGPVRNAGVEELELPDVARADEEVVGTAVLFGTGGDTVTFSLAAGDAPWDTTLVLPAGGRLRLPVRLQAPVAPGEVAATARVTLAGDAFPGDDRRSRVVAVDPAYGELVLVSWTPDWEPRFLFSVLQDVTGLRGQGWLRVGTDRFLSMHRPRELLGASEVLRRLGEARVAVVHAPPGAGGEGLARDSAVARVVGGLPRVVTVPGSVGSGGAPGEWFMAAEVPASPLAGELSGLPLVGLPPLAGVRNGDPSALPVLLLQRGGRGEALPGLVLREDGRGRRVEALAHGFWRWQMRGGTGRQLYRRLWSAAAGWLLADPAGPERAVGVAPLARVVPPGSPLAWRAGPAAGGRLEVAFTSMDLPEPGVPASEPPLAVDSLGRAQGSAPVESGVYRWTARVVEGPEPDRTASGLLVVEPGDLDLLRGRAVSLTEIPTARDGGTALGTERPLRTHPVPYLLLLGLLSVEWLLRRRSGLR